jgi:transcriptional regulator with XRE-family HTH domain
MARPRNIVGPQIKALREKRGLTQPMLAAKCHLLGWDLSRETLAKIESRIRWVADYELLCLAQSLGVSAEALLPPKEQIRAKLKSFFQRPKRD